MLIKPRDLNRNNDISLVLWNLKLDKLENFYCPTFVE